MPNIIDTDLSFGTLSHRGQTNRIIVHHAEASNASVETIHSWHRGNGWAGIGYHFYVRKDGTIYAGRPEWAVGSHAAGSNYDSIGVCFEGNYNRETMPQAQLDSGRELIQWLRGKYGIDTVQKHKDVYDTDCPGRNFPFDELLQEDDMPSAREVAEEVWNFNQNGVLMRDRVQGTDEAVNDIRKEVMRTDDPSGREKIMTDHEHIKWMAAKQADMDAKLDAILAKL